MWQVTVFPVLSPPTQHSSCVFSQSSTEALIEAATSTPLHVQGKLTRQGDSVEFVAEDLDEKIRMSSPLTKRGTFTVYLRCIIHVPWCNELTKRGTFTVYPRCVIHVPWCNELTKRGAFMWCCVVLSLDV